MMINSKIQSVFLHNFVLIFYKFTLQILLANKITGCNNPYSHAKKRERTRRNGMRGGQIQSYCSHVGFSRTTILYMEEGKSRASSKRQKTLLLAKISSSFYSLGMSCFSRASGSSNGSVFLLISMVQAKLCSLLQLDLKVLR